METKKVEKLIKNYINHKMDGVTTINLEGPPGSGKSLLVKKVAADLGSKLHTIYGSYNVSAEELTGMWEISERGNAEYRDGIIIKALKSANKDGIAILEIAEAEYLRKESWYPITQVLESDHCVRYPYYKPHRSVCLDSDSKLIIITESNLGIVKKIPESIKNKMEMDIILK